MSNLSIKEFSDLVYDKLDELNYEIVLSNPQTEDNTDELIEMHTPLKSTNRTVNAIPIKSTFQMSITCWNKGQRDCMEMTNEIEEKLQELNFVRTNTSSSIYDSIMQKYAITVTFEVRYNGLTNSFEYIR